MSATVTRAEPLVGNRLRHFVRQSTRGMIDTHAIAGARPMVLLFVPSLDDPECRSYISSFVSDLGEFRRLEAEVVVISANPPMSIPDIAMPVIAGASDLFAEYDLVHDEGVWAGVVIIDRDGIVDQWISEPQCRELPTESRVARLLQSAESSCPECGVAEQRWLDATR